MSPVCMGRCVEWSGVWLGRVGVELGGVTLLCAVVEVFGSTREPEIGCSPKIQMSICSNSSLPGPKTFDSQEQITKQPQSFHFN